MTTAGTGIIQVKLIQMVMVLVMFVTHVQAIQILINLILIRMVLVMSATHARTIIIHFRQSLIAIAMAFAILTTSALMSLVRMMISMGTCSEMPAIQMVEN